MSASRSGRPLDLRQICCVVGDEGVEKVEVEEEEGGKRWVKRGLFSMLSLISSRPSFVMSLKRRKVGVDGQADENADDGDVEDENSSSPGNDGFLSSCLKD